MSLNDRTSHASRNPGKAVQEARGRKKRDPNLPALTPAEKATRAKALKQRQQDNEAMFADIDAYYAQRAETIVALALKHDKTPDFIKSLLLNSSQFKAERKVSLRNAVTSHIAKTETADDGSKLSDTELQARVGERIAEGISDEDAQQWMQDVEDKRQLQRVGLRATNTASYSDVRATVDKVETSVHQLYERTGTRTLIFFSRGHVDDANRPVVLFSGGSDKFCIEVCKKPALQMLQEFELWSCTRSNQNVVRDTRASMAAQSAKLIEDRLRALVNDDKASASYKNFKVDIQEAWEVEIQGWPADIPFVCPAQIKNVERLRRLRDGWVKGTISWVPMTPQQVAELADELAAVRAGNDGVVVKRKERKDAGGTHAKPAKATKDKHAAKKDKHSAKKSKSRHPRDERGEAEGDNREEEEEGEEDVDPSVIPTPASTNTISSAATSMTVPVPAPIPTATAMPAATVSNGSTEVLTDPSLFPMAPALTGDTVPDEFEDLYLLSLLPDFDPSSFPMLNLETLGAGFGQNQAVGMSAFAPASHVPFAPTFDPHHPTAPALNVHHSPMPLHFDAHRPPFDVHLPTPPAFDAGHAVAPEFDVHPTQLQHHVAMQMPVHAGAAAVQHTIETPVPMQLATHIHAHSPAHAPASAFVAYEPMPLLGDGLNSSASRKRKAPGDASGVKRRKVAGENDPSERPKPKLRKTGAAATSNSRTPRMGPPRATAERDAAALAAQLPPRA
ncbi:hypothetical protein C8R43DRAFT_1117324 [Mycena crocata]|nr:hypothetical protein C8R43DRAFT_1117324 [Mycena crocata]